MPSLPAAAACSNSASGSVSHSVYDSRAAVAYCGGVPAGSRYKNRGDFSVSSTTRFIAASGSAFRASKWRSTSSVFSASLSGRRKAVSASFTPSNFNLATRSGASALVFAQLSMRGTTYAAASRAASVVACSHSFDTVVPRSQP